MGVTCKTAWRMGDQFRKYMGDVDGVPPITGHVEVDEFYVGGRRSKIRGFTGRRAKGKTVVFGIHERGGDLYTEVVPSAAGKSLIPSIVRHVPKGILFRFGCHGMVLLPFGGSSLCKPTHWEKQPVHPISGRPVRV